MTGTPTTGRREAEWTCDSALPDESVLIMKRLAAALLLIAAESSWAETKTDEVSAFATLKMAKETPADQVALRQLVLTLKSKPLLDEIGARMALQSAWSMDEWQVAARLKELLDASAPEGSAVGKVHAKGSSPANAAALANTAASVLRDHLEATTESRINDLKAAIRRQEETVLEKRKTLSRIIQKLGTISKHADPDNRERHPERTGLSDPRYINAQIDFGVEQRYLEQLRKQHAELVATPLPKIGQIAWAKAPTKQGSP